VQRIEATWLFQRARRLWVDQSTTPLRVLRGGPWHAMALARPLIGRLQTEYLTLSEEEAHALMQRVAE